MRKRLVTALFLFGAINILLLTILYSFLSQQGFDPVSFSVASVMFVLASLLSAYVVIVYLLEPKENQDERLMHLMREILHEINLPLSTIDANVKMLHRGDADSRMTKRLSRIEAAAIRLKRLYRELAYSIKREIMPIERESFDLAGMLAERIVQFEELERNSFEAALESIVIVADRIGLEQVIDNILENAMKFSEADSVIAIILSGSKLTIQDSGVGMDATQLLHIYERYYQGSESIGGEGIGLALVKRYCDEAGIAIKITSEVGEGTSVVLDFRNVLSFA